MRRAAFFARHAPGSGFSLIEVMVAIALTGIMLVGVAAIFGSTRATSQATEGLAQAHETGQRAMRQLVGAIRSAGFPGCTRNPSFRNSTLSHGDAFWEVLHSSIRGFRADAASELHQSWIPGAVPGSDVLLVPSTQNHHERLRLAADMRSASDSLVLAPVLGRPAAGETALISDCEAVVYFAVTGNDHGLIEHAALAEIAGATNATESFGYQFRAGSEIFVVDPVFYYVASSADGTVLMKRIGTSSPVVVAGDVARLELEFGSDLDADEVIDAYQTAEAVLDWERVLSVRVTVHLVGDGLAARGRSGSTPDRFTAIASLRAREQVN